MKIQTRPVYFVYFFIFGFFCVSCVSLNFKLPKDQKAKGVLFQPPPAPYKKVLKEGMDSAYENSQNKNVMAFFSNCSAVTPWTSLSAFQKDLLDSLPSFQVQTQTETTHQDQKAFKLYLNWAGRKPTGRVPPCAIDCDSALSSKGAALSASRSGHKDLEHKPFNKLNPTGFVQGVALSASRSGHKDLEHKPFNKLNQPAQKVKSMSLFLFKKDKCFYALSLVSASMGEDVQVFKNFIKEFKAP